MVCAVLSWVRESRNLVLSIPAVFGMPFSFRLLRWVLFEEGQQTEHVWPCLKLIHRTWSLVQQHGRARA